MLSRGRPCLRRRLPAVSDTVATGSNEPLLFLYPRWVAPALQQRTFSQKPIELPASTCRASRVPFRPLVPAGPSFARHSCRWISATPNRTAASTPTQSHDPDVDSLEEHNGIEPDSDNSGSSYDDQIAAGLELDASEWVELDASEWPEQGISSAPAESKRPEAQCLVQNRFNSRDLASLSREQRIKRDHSFRDQAKLRARKYMKERYRKEGSYYIDNAWFGTKDILAGITQTKTPRRNTIVPSKDKEILVTEETLATFAGVNQYTYRENIFYISINNGCRVQVLPVEQNKGMLRRVILSGTNRAVELAEADFSHAQKARDSHDPLSDIHQLAAPICSSEEAMASSRLSPPLIRGFWLFGPKSLKPVTLDQLTASRPTVTSCRDFTELVEDVVSSISPLPSESSWNDSSHRQGPLKSLHKTRVAKGLENLFYARSNYRYLSTAALHLALEWFCHHQLVPMALSLCTHNPHLTTVESYNIMMKHCAKQQDVKRFRQIAYRMDFKKIPPNPQTWVVLLSSLTNAQEKADLIAYMAQNNLLSDRKIIQDVLHQTIQDSLLVHLDSGKSINSFIRLMANTYGADKVGRALLGQIFAALARLKDHASIDRMMRICMDRNLEMDGSPLTSLIKINRGNIRKAIRYFSRFLTLARLPVLDQNYEALFLCAYSASLYNVCLVVWRYACLNECVTTKMKQTVIVTLCANASRRKPNGLKALWNLDAGKVIAGIDLNHGSNPIPAAMMNQLPEEYRDNPMSFLDGWKAEGEGRETQVQLAHAIVQRDQSFASTHRPEHPMQIMLEAAIHVDEEWKGIPRPLSWKMQNAIHVPLVPRELPEEDLSSIFGSIHH